MGATELMLTIFVLCRLGYGDGIMPKEKKLECISFYTKCMEKEKDIGICEKKYIEKQ